MPDTKTHHVHFSEKQEKGIYEVFLISILLKGINAVLEIALGLLLLFTNLVNDIVLALAENELIEDPSDFFARHLESFVLAPQAQFLGGLYLIGHGLVKVFLVAGLLQKKMWAFPATIAVLSLFILYQMIRFASTHSIPLLLLSIFDAMVVWLVYHEYKRYQKVLPAEKRK